MISLRHIGLTAVTGAFLVGAAPRAESVDPVTLPAIAAVTPPPPATPAAPLLAVAEVDDLRSDLDRMMNGSTARNASYGVLIVSLDRGDTLFSYNPDRPLAPASNMKLFSTAAALYYLGPDFRYSTYTLADGEIRDGVLDGDLVLYGTGDPTISSRMLPGALTPLRALVDSLKALGVRQIQGDVVGDGSYFDDRYIGTGWREEYRLAAYSAPIGALSLAENIVGIRVTPGASAGEPANIRTTPATHGLLVQNNVRTVSSGRSTVRFSYSPDGITIEGQLQRGHPGVARTVTVVDPGNFAAAAFANLLEDAGIDVVGRVRSVTRPEDSPINRATRAPAEAEGIKPPPRVIGTHLSPTLAEIVSVTNHVSQNLYAEAMFKTVGRVALGEGTFEAGAEAVRYFLECENPVDFGGLNQIDGSGLSPLNTVTPRVMIHLLDLMTRTDVWDSFFESLPEAASPNGGLHSLRNRMGGTAAARNLRAKTGTINGVSGLSGYVRADNGELLAFSIFGNDLGSTWSAKRLEDGIGARLARFSRPSPEESIPAPEPVGQPTDTVEAEVLPVTPPASAAAAPAPSPAPAARAPSSTPPAAPATRTHTVTSGETLDAIAKRYDTSVSELQRLNPRVSPRTMQIGQSITIPGSSAAAPASSPSAAPARQNAAPATRTHKVSNGENFEVIARRYDTTVAELRRLNPRVEPRRIQIGQSLVIPAE